MTYICFHCGISFDKRRKKSIRYFCSRECCLDQLQQEQSDGYTIIRHAYKKAQHRAKRARIDFTITLEYAYGIWIKQAGTCALSGLPIHYAGTKLGKRSGANTASMDRKDSSIGYVPGNIQFIYKDIQKMKWDTHEDKFICMCRYIAEYTRSREIGWVPPDMLDITEHSGTIAVEATDAPTFDAEYYKEAF